MLISSTSCIQQLREAAEMTQSELAAKAGLTQIGIAQLERGVRSPTWGTVLLLAHALGVPCTEFTKKPTVEKRKAGRPKKGE
jgi:transcriptional regulator with XRE-family HTH domain